MEKSSREEKKLAKSKNAKTTQRSHLTAYIKDVLKSRQEDVPVMSSYIERATSEPLHLKNNNVKELFLKVLKIVTSQSDIKNETFKDVDESTLLFKFCNFMRRDMGCNFLVVKLGQWFNESGG